MNSKRTISLFAACLTAICLGVTAPAFGGDLQADFADRVQQAGLGKATFGLYVVDLDANRELVAINADDAFIPASNMKLVTSAAALCVLGPQFAFRTELRYAGAAKNGSVIVVRGDGDPGFCDPKLLAANGLDVERILDTWVGAVQKAGV